MRILSILAVLVIAGCASDNTTPLGESRATDQEVYKRYASACTYTDGRTPAPEWVCGYPISEYAITEVGFSKRGIEEEAKAIALSKLAGRVLTEVQTDITATIEGRGNSESRDFNAKTIQTIEQSLINTRVLLRQPDPLTGGLYVLVVAEEQAYADAIHKAKMALR